MKTLHKIGNIIDHTATTDISSGDVVVMGNLVGISVNDIADGTTGPVLISGAVKTTLKHQPQTWTQGVDLFWDASASKWTTVAAGNSRGGVAFLAAVSAATTGYVLLNQHNAAIQTGEIADDAVTTAKILDEAVTVGKMADLARGSILSGQTASDRPTALDASGDGQILVGDGNDVASVSVSGAIGLSNAGVATIQDGAVEDSMIEALASGELIIGVDGTAANNAKVTVSGAIGLSNAGVASLGNVAEDQTVPGAIGVIPIAVAGGASADYDVTLTQKVRVIDVVVVHKGAGDTSDTITVKSTADAITNDMDYSGGDTTVVRAGTIDDAFHEIAIGGILRVSAHDNAGTNGAAGVVYVHVMAVA